MSANSGRWRCFELHCLLVVCVGQLDREGLQMVPSLHDNLLVSYAVKCEAGTIRLRARRPHWPDRFVLFTGVEGYHFQNDAFGNIVFSLEKVPVDRVLSQFGLEIRESYRQAGAPGPWAADLD